MSLGKHNFLKLNISLTSCKTLWISSVSGFHETVRQTRQLFTHNKNARLPQQRLSAAPPAQDVWKGVVFVGRFHENILKLNISSTSCKTLWISRMSGFHETVRQTRHLSTHNKTHCSHNKDFLQLLQLKISRERSKLWPVSIIPIPLPLSQGY